MNKRAFLIAGAVAAVVAFAAGYVVSPGGGSGSDGSSGEREILYYVDPMNPSFRSPEPGTAPCGMALEPVYADGRGGGSDQRGVINVRADRQQLIGVTTSTAVHAAVPHELRLLGTVEVDENRLYDVTSITDGWIREITDATTGSFVRKSQVLAKFYSQSAYNPQQSFIYALNNMERNVRTGQRAPDQGPPVSYTHLTLPTNA